MGTNASTLRGPELLAAAVEQIAAHPETWNQREWHSRCGSTHCVAGHVELIALGEQTCCTFWTATDLLGLTVKEADWLFDPNRTLPQLYRFTQAYLAGEVIDLKAIDNSDLPMRLFEVTP